eukprot:TRINITY_DN25267_c0_g1_i3.p1 TRINITY_DN25267_c0_g1~~TRINITY_DN25267_c0_g1_i3.p1  ORF type:complete len:510 (-),score=96.86 TRINITY_DN25267_c0_g1_i3:83-1612(-)
MAAAQQKTLICKFWMSNRCSRLDCKYAHGEEEKRASCSKLLCRYSHDVDGARSTLANAVSQDGARVEEKAVEELESEARTEHKNVRGSPVEKASEEIDSIKAIMVIKEFDDAGVLVDDASSDADTAADASADMEGSASAASASDSTSASEGASPPLVAVPAPSASAVLSSRLSTTSSCEDPDCLSSSGDGEGILGLANDDRQFSSEGRDFCGGQLDGTYPPRRNRCASARSTNASSTWSQDDDLENANSQHLRSKPSDKTMLCKFHLNNRCERGACCKYAHTEAEKRAACAAILCQFHFSGRCRLGSECLYSHDDKKKECLGLPGNSAFSRRPTAATEKPSRDSEWLTVSRTSWRSSSEADPKDVQEYVPGAHEKTQLCKFWQKQQCRRNQDCKFAHGVEEQRRACRATPCRDFRRGHCSLGDSCWFGHSSTRNPKTVGEPAVFEEARTRTKSDPAGAQAACDSEEHRNRADSDPVGLPLFKILPGWRQKKWADLADVEDDFELEELPL